jgi:ATP-dependent Clp protease ATP-binding subunit ClpC
MFERFTEKGIKVIMLTQEESRRLGHCFCCTEQILIGSIAEDTGIAAQVLKSMGVTLTDAQKEVEKLIGRGAGFVAQEIPFTPAAKRVLKFAQEESQQLGHNYVSTEHLLLGTLREKDGNACKVLTNLGVDLTQVRTEVMQMLGVTTEFIIPSQFSAGNTRELDIKRLLDSIEAKTIEIERTFSSLQQDIAALRKQIEG